MNTTPLHDDAYIRGVAVGFPEGDSRRTELLEIARRVQERNETYDKPLSGWTCFHCGETFTTVGAARDHFGSTMDAVAACRIKAGAEKGILMALRRAENDLAHYREEDQPAIHEMARLQSRHSDALRDAEELGYERGLKDGMSVAAKTEPLTDSYVQRVPDKCDRIVWRNMYYHLPLGPVSTHEDMVPKIQHEVACATIARQHADIDTIRGYLNATKQSCERRGVELAAALAENVRMRGVVEEVHSWAVCGAITTPEDMMQNLPRIVEITTTTGV